MYSFSTREMHMDMMCGMMGMCCMFPCAKLNR
jgi:hypothetical protein